MQDHHRVVGALLRLPSHWRRPCGRPRTSWLKAIDTDVQSVNIGIHSAWRKASSRTLWRHIVDTATPPGGRARHCRRRRTVQQSCVCCVGSVVSSHRGGRGGKDPGGTASRHPEYSRSMSSDNWREAKKRDAETDVSVSWRSRADHGRTAGMWSLWRLLSVD